MICHDDTHCNPDAFYQIDLCVLISAVSDEKWSEFCYSFPALVCCLTTGPQIKIEDWVTKILMVTLYNYCVNGDTELNIMVKYPDVYSL
jgi:hypothetical protein